MPAPLMDQSNGRSLVSAIYDDISRNVFLQIFIIWTLATCVWYRHPTSNMQEIILDGHPQRALNPNAFLIGACTIQTHGLW